jgi:hypothetical protein
MSLKFLKFKSVQNIAKNFWKLIKRKDEITKLNKICEKINKTQHGQNVKKYGVHLSLIVPSLFHLYLRIFGRDVEA